MVNLPTMNKAALSEYFNWAAGQPARLGSLDCVRFVADCLVIGWGADYRDRLGYDDRRTAVKRLKDAGGLEAACDDVLGDSLPANELVTGDVALLDGPAIGIVINDYIALKFRGIIARIPKERAIKGWRAWALQ